MDHYIQHGCLLWRKEHTAIAKLLIRQVTKLIRSAKYCEYDPDRVTFEEGFAQYRLKVPGHVGTYTLSVQVYCNPKTSAFALEVGMGYTKNPLWIMLPESNVVDALVFRNAWRKCMSHS
jgi:hypothetical protein